MIGLPSSVGGRRVEVEGIVARKGLSAIQFGCAADVQALLIQTRFCLRESGAKYVGLIVAIFLALNVMGCATQMSPAPVAQIVATSTPVASQPLQTFVASGRFSAKRNESAANGQFRYEQRGANRALEIFTPASTPLARIDATAQLATLTMADGQTRGATSLSELLQSFIDIRVTDAQFSAWLQGVPSAANATSAVERDAQSRLARFTEAGWMIEVNARFADTPNAARRMRWVYSPETDTELRWVIDEFAAQ